MHNTIEDIRDLIFNFHQNMSLDKETFKLSSLKCDPAHYSKFREFSALVQ